MKRKRERILSAPFLFLWAIHGTLQAAEVKRDEPGFFWLVFIL